VSRSKPRYALALVTGPTAGIGQVFARKLAASGTHLVLVARNAERLHGLADELTRSHAIQVEVLAADLAQPSDLRGVEDRVEALDLDLLVNNAGFGLRGRFLQLPADEHERMVRVHVIAPIRLARAALPGMIARGRGQIVNVSSLAGFSPAVGGSLYGATKACLTYFSEALGIEIAGTGVQIQALCPGFTHTEFHERARMDEEAIPAWMWMDAQEVVEASLHALEQGKAVCVPGARNRSLAALMGALPRPVARWIAGRARVGRHRLGDGP
jgi:short-subunit dehydrogenase